MEQLNINFGALIKNVAVDMYGYEVGQEVRAVAFVMGQGYNEPKSLTVIDKKETAAGFTYLVSKTNKRGEEMVGVAQAISDRNVADVQIYNARIIGVTDPEFGVESMEQARQELGF
jgi:hypothetical protein